MGALGKTTNSQIHKYRPTSQSSSAPPLTDLTLSPSPLAERVIWYKGVKVLFYGEDDVFSSIHLFTTLYIIISVVENGFPIGSGMTRMKDPCVFLL